MKRVSTAFGGNKKKAKTGGATNLVSPHLPIQVPQLEKTIYSKSKAGLTVDPTLVHATLNHPDFPLTDPSSTGKEGDLIQRRRGVRAPGATTASASPQLTLAPSENENTRKNRVFSVEVEVHPEESWVPSFNDGEGKPLSVKSTLTSDAMAAGVFANFIAPDDMHEFRQIMACEGGSSLLLQFVFRDIASLNAKTAALLVVSYKKEQSVQEIREQVPKVGSPSKFKDLKKQRNAAIQKINEHSQTITSLETAKENADQYIKELEAKCNGVDEHIAQCSNMKAELTTAKKELEINGPLLATCQNDLDAAQTKIKELEQSADARIKELEVKLEKTVADDNANVDEAQGTVTRLERCIKTHGKSCTVIVDEVNNIMDLSDDEFERLEAEAKKANEEKEFDSVDTSTEPIVNAETDQQNV